MRRASALVLAAVVGLGWLLALLSGVFRDPSFTTYEVRCADGVHIARAQWYRMRDGGCVEFVGYPDDETTLCGCSSVRTISRTPTRQ